MRNPMKPITAWCATLPFSVLPFSAISLGALLLAGCNLDTRSFEVRVVNLTENQPFSPLAVILHDANYAPWVVGSSASEGLERLSESGDNSLLLEQASENLSHRAQFNTRGRQSFVSGAGVISPGEEARVVTSKGGSDVLLSAATMLVNTNDGFAGASALDVSSLSVGDEVLRYLPVYDAGTESNSESPDAIPGPAGGGEGFNALRDDVDYVAHHPGVVSAVDGYVESALDQSHRFDGPVALLVIKRIE